MNVMLTIVLCGCEISSLTLWEERRLSMFYYRTGLSNSMELSPREANVTSATEEFTNFYGTRSYIYVLKRANHMSLS
jgi:hypothetical protein